jgi:HK97 family phage prohead protease
VDTDEQRLAALEAEWRKKYNTAEREKLAKEGKALPDGSYPIVDKEDLENAATLAASGHGDVDAAKALIRKRAKELGVDVEGLPGFGKESKAAELWDAEHRSGPSHAQLSSAISKAIRDLPEAGSLSAYLCDFDDDTATYESGGKTFQVPYKVKGDGTVKLGDPQEVQRHTEYKPVESKSVYVGRRKERRRAIPLMPEVRHFRAEGLEIREKANTNEMVVTGAPIKYDVGYRVFDLFGEFEERMRPGCVSELLARGVDCRLLLNHEGLAMARTTAGTLRLWDTPVEMRMEATLDARQQLANDFAIAVQRGDMTEMSVGMFVGRDLWGEEDGIETRDVLRLDNLLDVSGVTYAASPTTNIEIAQRMMLAAPVESRARLRRMIVDDRAGKVLSGSSSTKVASAIEALHALYEAGGGDPADLIQGDEGESESDETALAQDGTRSEDGEPIRSSALALRLQLEARARPRKRRIAA